MSGTTLRSGQLSNKKPMNDFTLMPGQKSTNNATREGAVHRRQHAFQCFVSKHVRYWKLRGSSIWELLHSIGHQLVLRQGRYINFMLYIFSRPEPLGEERLPYSISLQHQVVRRFFSRDRRLERVVCHSASTTVHTLFSCFSIVSEGRSY